MGFGIQSQDGIENRIVKQSTQWHIQSDIHLCLVKSALNFLCFSYRPKDSIENNNHLLQFLGFNGKRIHMRPLSAFIADTLIARAKDNDHLFIFGLLVRNIENRLDRYIELQLQRWDI